MNKYRFFDEDKKHLHQLWSERKEDWENLTGCTSILDVLGKTLTWWAAELSAVECLEVGEKIPTIREEYTLAATSDNKSLAIRELEKKYPLFKKARYAHSVRLDKTADAGTDLHEKLERYVKLCLISSDGKPLASAPSEKVADFSDWAIKNVKRFLWSEIHCFDELLFVGGITDAGAELNDGTYAIIDFKSAKEVYFNHFVQIAIYNLLIDKNGGYDKKGNKTFTLDKPITKYIVVPFGANKFKVVESNNIKGLQDAGLSAISLYRQKGYFENK